MTNRRGGKSLLAGLAIFGRSFSAGRPWEVPHHGVFFSSCPPCFSSVVAVQERRTGATALPTRIRAQSVPPAGGSARLATLTCASALAPGVRSLSLLSSPLCRERVAAG